MEHCDVLIVGGGPAGSTAARALTRAGLDVVVLDKQDFPRDKTCAGWITPAVADALELDLEDYARERVLQPITGFRVGRMDGPVTHFRYDQPVSYGILRCEFDHYLLQRAGARLLLGTALRRLERRDGRWVADERVSAPLVIGAGGHFCPVARALGNRPGKGEAAITAQEVEFQLTPEQDAACPVRGDTPELYFCADLKGYAWCFHKGGYLNVGLGREDNHHLSTHVEAFIRELQAAGRLPADMPTRFKGHAYLLYGHTPRRVIGEGALLVGDAAGLAYAQSGEGIRPAVESALLAARAVTRGGADAAALRDYEAALESRFGSRHPSRDPVPAGLRRWLGRRLLANAWFDRHVVIDRWFLHRHLRPLQV